VRNGKSIVYYPSGNIYYDGNFKNNNYDGYGILYRDNEHNSIIHDGNWKDDILNGFVKSYNESGKLMYKGNYHNGDFNGNGILYYDNGETYEGGFKDGKEHGTGILYYNYGNYKYECEWKDGKRCDIGKFQYQLNDCNIFKYVLEDYTKFKDIQNKLDIQKNNFNKLNEKFGIHQYSKNKLDEQNTKLLEEIQLLKNDLAQEKINNFELKDQLKEMNQIKQENTKLKEESGKSKDYDKIKSNSKKLEKKIKDLNKEIKKFNKEMKNKEDKYNEEIKEQIKLKQDKTDEISKKNKQIKNLNTKIKTLEERLEELTISSDLSETLSAQIVEYEKRANPPKNKQQIFMIAGLEYNKQHPNWNPEYGKILYEFQSCLHDKNKIENLIIKCGWILKNSNNHKVYTRITDRGYEQKLFTPTTPSSENSWKSVWCNLKKLEIDRILS